MNIIFNRSFAKPITLQPHALYECLAERIRQRILSHELAPGDSVDETILLKEYGVSRTPVREALKMLHHEGLLTAKPRRGMFVTVLTQAEVQETWAIHGLLQAHVKADTPTLPQNSPLLGKMLAITEQHLRLAYGPAFPEKMARAAKAAQTNQIKMRPHTKAQAVEAVELLVAGSTG